MRTCLVLLLLLGCGSDEESPSASSSSDQPRFSTLECGYGLSDWRLEARLKEVSKEVAPEHGAWKACHETRTTDECQQRRFEPECLRAFGTENQVDFGVRARAQVQGSAGSWDLTLYDLRSGEEAARETRECDSCTEGRVEELYREAFASLLERATR